MPGSGQGELNFCGVLAVKTNDENMTYGNRAEVAAEAVSQHLIVRPGFLSPQLPVGCSLRHVLKQWDK